MLRWTLIGLLSASLLACDDTSAVSVRVCGDLVVPSQLDALRVTAYDADGNEKVSGVLQLVECPDAAVRHLPVVHQLGEWTGEHRILVQGLADGVEIIRGEARTRLDGDVELSVPLNAACVGIGCPLGQTCVDGGCEVIPFHEESPIPCPAALPGPSHAEPSDWCEPEGPR